MSGKWRRLSYLCGEGPACAAFSAAAAACGLCCRALFLYNDTRMNGSHTTERVAALRRLMAARGWAAVVVPTGDPHGNEYPLDRWKLREWLTGFTGSAGTAVVTATDAALWTDSRYWLAAEEALSGTPFSLMREGATGTPTPARWLQELHVVGEVAVPYAVSCGCVPAAGPRDRCTKSRRRRRG